MGAGVAKTSGTWIPGLAPWFQGGIGLGFRFALIEDMRYLILILLPGILMACSPNDSEQGPAHLEYVSQ